MSVTAADYLGRDGTLAVIRQGAAGHEIFLLMSEDGSILGFNGHVDLGTGIATALAQIVAEEMDVALARVAMILGDGKAGPEQGATIASETIQVAAKPLRQAAAQARRFLVDRAAVELGLDPATLTVDDGVIGDSGNRRISYGELLAGQRYHLTLDESVAVKRVEDYRIVGKAAPRVDIPAKAVGSFTYVHDMRVPGMLHGRVVRPPYAGIDSGGFVGNSLVSVDRASISGVPGIVAVVVIRDFVGIVAEREEYAIEAAQRLKVVWKAWTKLPDLNAPEAALRAQPSVRRVLRDTGGVDAALEGAAKRLKRSYVWPYQMHGSIGPSCALADYRDDGMVVWSGTQNPQVLRRDLARLLAMDEGLVDVVRLEAAGCYGRNCADDVAGDAALLSRAVGRPVRVQLSREQEHAWEPKGAAQVVDVDGGLDADGGIAAYDFTTCFPSNAAPLLALLLTGEVAPEPEILKMGDRTAVPPYDIAAMRVVVNDMAPIVRASWLRGVAALPNSFAHECYIDELAAEAGVDPIEFRLRYLSDERARALIEAVAAKAGWQSHTKPGTAGKTGDILHGRGFAYALYVHGPFPGTAAAWSAWVADVDVNTRTGEVAVTKVVVGQDSGLMINPAGVRHQIHGNVIQSTSRVLTEQVEFSDEAVTSRDWGTYQIMSFDQLPAIETVLMPRPTEPPLGAGESASVPSAAAIANAIYDATGVRLRSPPFTPERVLEGLGVEKPERRTKRGVLGAFAAGMSLVALALPFRPAIDPIPPPDPTVYAQATILRGEALASSGACAECHTGAGGITNAGGRAIETPFGRVIATNITPDVETGIGGWSYPAFERAMRYGIHQDGRHLYPAFPYTAYTKMSAADLQALYAYLMAQEPVRSARPKSALRFPFNIRPLLAVWNVLFLRPGPEAAKPDRSAEWNRGAYLADSVGHCGACHSPRNLLGAERGGAAYLTGAMVDGWEAPALTSATHAPIAWTEDEMFAYLRTGYSAQHGVAAGPMAPVIQGLAALPDSDIRALSVYLASFSRATGNEAAQAAELEAKSIALADPSADARLFDGSCGACHHSGDGPVLFGVRPSLAVSSKLHSARPDNLIQIILNGVAEPASPKLGYMPGFGATFDDGQIARLAIYLRARFAPDRPDWDDIEATVKRLRAKPRS
jgi:nicotinate dehydrogenase subunit B